MRGDWSEVWDSFDRRKKAGANDVAEPEGEAGDDMFARAGLAAE